jgi:hypothetical protein
MHLQMKARATLPNQTACWCHCLMCCPGCGNATGCHPIMELLEIGRIPEVPTEHVHGGACRCGRLRGKASKLPPILQLLVGGASARGTQWMKANPFQGALIRDARQTHRSRLAELLAEAVPCCHHLLVHLQQHAEAQAVTAHHGQLQQRDAPVHPPRRALRCPRWATASAAPLTSLSALSAALPEPRWP